LANNTPESIARQILGLYEDNYATHLATVEANWAATEPITLYDFEERRITIMPENVTVYMYYPSLGIGVGNLREVATGDLQIQRAERVYLMDVRLVYYLRGVDDQQLAKVVLRHIEATLLFLQAHPRLGLGRLFEVQNIIIEPSANVYDTGGNSLVKGLRTRFELRFIQRGP
jgi:hypothetical protein